MSCFDITSTGSLHKGQSSSCSIGQLYLRLARLPPSSEDFTQLTKPDVTIVQSSKSNYSTGYDLVFTMSISLCINVINAHHTRCNLVSALVANSFDLLGDLVHGIL